MFVVPDAHPRVQLVVDDTCAASHISTNTGVAPCGTFRAGDAIGVEIAGNRSRALTRCKLAEDALDDERFRWIDLALPAHTRSAEPTSELQSLMRNSDCVILFNK